MNAYEKKKVKKFPKVKKHLSLFSTLTVTAIVSLNEIKKAQNFCLLFFDAKNDWKIF